ncbi:hypothetical protein KAR48_17410 [bacterium]|nr:hypothetical protein [bacterium]
MYTTLWNSFKNSNAQKAVIEFLVIVLSIIIAFSLDNWGENRRKNIRELQYLQQLNLDFKENERQLLGVLEQDQIRFEYSEKILSLLKEEPEASHKDSLARWIPFILSYSMYIPITGTYDAMLSSGDINLIRNIEVRTNIISFAGILKELQTHLHRFSSWTIDLLNSPAADDFFTVDMLLTGKDDSGTIDYGNMLRDRDFNRLITRLHVVSLNKISFHNGLLTEARKLKKNLMTEVGEQGLPIDFDTNRYLGKYEIAEGFYFYIFNENGQLRIRVTGQISANLYAESTTDFYCAISGEHIQFLLDDEKNTTGLVFIQNGQETTALKVE